ncbi:MAG TPA: 4-hydroxy-3-methylbut-2-enyl diphosphate reductase [Candidatus Binatia bacterium]|nr:4-hydroxy-3-methylbut-2-enyl diphosphate reductase [Candidatus Binatia bacterium]
MPVKQVVIAEPRGFCAGVEMAIETVERALKKYGAPVYVFHEIVHNRHVVEDFTRRGVTFVSSVDDVPAGGRLVFSAHGVAPEVRRKARERGLEVVIDATCPLVDKVHREVRRFAAQGYWIVLVGHETHDEIVGTSGEAPERIKVVESAADVEKLVIPDRDKIAVLTQTTLSVDDTRGIIDALRRRFPKIVAPAKEDICYATQNRQDAVKELAAAVDHVLVIGSKNSENSSQLCKVARARGVPAYLINDISELDPKWLDGVARVGITAGASAPDHLVSAAADFFARHGAQVSKTGFVEENIHFALPAEIADPS